MNGRHLATQQEGEDRERGNEKSEDFIGGERQK